MACDSDQVCGIDSDRFFMMIPLRERRLWFTNGVYIRCVDCFVGFIRDDAFRFPGSSMTALGVAKLFLLVGVALVVWERRLTFGSRFDSPITVGTVLFGAGVGLTAPWPVVAGVAFPFAGKNLALIVVGQFCFLAATGFGIKAVYLRLLSDEAIDPFMRRRIAPLIAVAGVALIMCFVGSSLSLPRPVGRPSFASLDGWLAVSWLVYFGILAMLGLILSYGVARLRRDPRSLMLRILLLSLVPASLSAVLIGYALVSSGHVNLWMAAWLINYVAFFGIAIAFVMQWRRRLRNLLPAGESS